MAFNGVVTADRLVEPSYGLFSVARVKNRGARDEHWIGGFYVETVACSTSTEGVPLCAAGEDFYTIHEATDDSPFFHVVGFGILEKYQCENSIGINAVDRRATVIEQVKRVSEFAVEDELWSGTAAQLDSGSLIPATRWLSSAVDVTPTPSTAVKPALAIALVEQAFAENNPGIQATIHVTPLIADALRKSYFFEKDGQLKTANGSLVTISRGGGGTEGPASGSSTTKHWVYATGPVHVDLGSEELITVSASESVNPKNNSVIFAAERPAAVYFDGCAWYGALADATL